MKAVHLKKAPSLLLYAFLCVGCSGEKTEDSDEFAVPETSEQVESGVESSPPDPAEAPAADSVFSESAVQSDSVEDLLRSNGFNPDSLHFERPEHVRGIYLNAWSAGSSRRSAALIELAGRTEINSFVIDLKDASGYVSHPSTVPLIAEVGALEELRIRDLPGLLSRLHEAGIYPIARIVMVKDPILAAARPEWTVQDTAGGAWLDGKGVSWMDFYREEVWEYNLDLAREAVALGFPEIQWDYVRFPDAPKSIIERTTYPHSNGQSKPEAVRAFLSYAREELSSLGAIMTADVFGVTTTGTDVGIGQVWGEMIDVVDVALPMVYPSHYWVGSYGIEDPNGHPYEIIVASLRDALQESERVASGEYRAEQEEVALGLEELGDDVPAPQDDRSESLESHPDPPPVGSIRPWLQDFSLGDPAYGAPEVRAQIQAVYDIGISEWILWNPSSRYTEEALMPSDGTGDEGEASIRIAGHVVPARLRGVVLSLTQPLDLVPGFPLVMRMPF